MQSISASLPQLLGQANNVVAFCLYLRGAFDYFLSKSSNKIIFSEKQLRDFKDLIETTAKDSGSKFNVSCADNSGNITINYYEANTAQNVINKKIEETKMEASTEHKKRLFEWYQSKFRKNNAVGDKAVIVEIYDGPVNVIFENDEEKLMMMRKNEKYPETEWQNLIYYVDVVVVFKRNRPISYRITKVYPELTFSEEQTELDFDANPTEEA